MKSPATPRILVVDDAEKNSRLLVDLLTAKGYRASAVASGEEALARIEADPPDLVLLDVMMPGLSGYEVCERLRAEACHAFLPIVLVTALDPAKERLRGIEAGADDFLSKPINPAELLARVKSLLRVKALHDELLRSRADPGGQGGRTVADGEHDRVVLQLSIVGLHEAPAAEAARRLGELVHRLRAAVDEGRGWIAALDAARALVVFDGADPRKALLVASSLVADARGSPDVGLAAAVTSGPVWVGEAVGMALAIGAPVAAAARLASAAAPGTVLVDAACAGAGSGGARFEPCDATVPDGSFVATWRMVGSGHDPA